MRLHFKETHYHLYNKKVNLYKVDKNNHSTYLGSIKIVRNGLVGKIQKMWLDANRLTHLVVRDDVKDRDKVYSVKKDDLLRFLEQTSSLFELSGDGRAIYIQKIKNDFMTQMNQTYSFILSILKSYKETQTLLERQQFAKNFILFTEEDYASFRDHFMKSKTERYYSDPFTYDTFVDLVIQRVFEAYGDEKMDERLIPTIQFVALGICRKISNDFMVTTKDLVEYFIPQQFQVADPEKKLSKEEKRLAKQKEIQTFVNYYNQLERQLLKFIN